MSAGPLTDDAYEAACEQHADWLSGWAGTHDYDPTWDYTVAFEHRQHPLYLSAQTALERICADAQAKPEIPFASGRVFPAHLDGAAALFISGTASEPVVLVDVDCHAEVAADEQEKAIIDSVLHELRHAVQEAHGWEPCEDEAEHGSARMPF